MIGIADRNSKLAIKLRNETGEPSHFIANFSPVGMRSCVMRARLLSSIAIFLSAFFGTQPLFRWHVEFLLRGILFSTSELFIFRFVCVSATPCRTIRK